MVEVMCMMSVQAAAAPLHTVTPGLMQHCLMQGHNRGGMYKGVAWYAEFQCRYLGLPKPSKQGANAEADPTGLQDPALANLGRSVCVYAQAAGCGLQLIGACVWRNSTVRADTPGPGQLECIVIVSAAW
jgi:hypothetical protein